MGPTKPVVLFLEEPGDLADMLKKDVPYFAHVDVITVASLEEANRVLEGELRQRIQLIMIGYIPVSFEDMLGWVQGVRKLSLPVIAMSFFSPLQVALLEIVGVERGEKNDVVKYLIGRFPLSEDGGKLDQS